MVSYKQNAIKKGISQETIDLAFRKISNKGIFEKYLTLIDDEIKECSNLENLKPFIEKFEKYKELMINFTNWLRNKIKIHVMSRKYPNGKYSRVKNNPLIHCVTSTFSIIQQCVWFMSKID